MSPIGPEALQCAKCQNVYPIDDGIATIMPAPVPSDVRTYFERVARDVQPGQLSYVPFSAPQLDRQLLILSKAFVRVLRRWVRSGSIILDVGTGHGALLGALASEYALVGVDFVFEMLRLAKSRGMDVYQADATALPFESNQFDAVVCAEMLQHVAVQEPVLAELVRVCRPGGAVIVSTLYERSALRALVRTFSRALRPSAFALPIIRRSPASIIDVAEQLSLRFIDVAWVLSPTTAIIVGRGRSHIAAPLATNFILRFEKQ